VRDEDDRLLLTLRRDTRRWALIGGIVEPGEQPAHAASREVLEETGVEARIDRLVSVIADPPKQYPNGDWVQFLTLSFVLKRVAGEARVTDDESLEVGWFPLDGRPTLSDLEESRLTHALAQPQPTYYEG
jgi:ADP-ribose pyrophosphatase YjhB (NUDIX family)